MNMGHRHRPPHHRPEHLRRPRDSGPAPSPSWRWPCPPERGRDGEVCFVDVVVWGPPAEAAPLPQGTAGGRHRAPGPRRLDRRGRPCAPLTVAPAGMGAGGAEERVVVEDPGCLSDLAGHQRAENGADAVRWLHRAGTVLSEP